MKRMLAELREGFATRQQIEQIRTNCAEKVSFRGGTGNRTASGDEKVSFRGGTSQLQERNKAASVEEQVSFRKGVDQLQRRIRYRRGRGQ
jgi:hypothetical protein